MKKFWLVAICFIVLLAAIIPIAVTAHSGRTDSDGGHYNHSTGDYHYHHGYSAHDHYDMDGDGIKDCPYEFDDKTDHSSTTSSNKSAQKAKTSDIITAIFEIIGISLLLLVYVGYPLYTVAMTLMGAFQKKIFKREADVSTSSIAKVVAAIVAVAIVVSIVSVIVLLLEGIM